MRFSANLGFLWTELALPEAIRAAGAAGFDAVECHWPYAEAVDAINDALAESGLTMLGLNTRRGEPQSGDMGLAALPQRREEAQAAIVEAIDYARQIAAPRVHVMAGIAQGESAHRCFVDNLRFACDRAQACGITILVEPLNRHDAPGYFLSTTDQAVSVMDDVAMPNIRLMFDCYHVQRTEGDVTYRLKTLLPRIGHIQFAGVPDRGPPDRGELDYACVFDLIDSLGWDVPLGAEYRPGGETAASLGWMQTLRSGA